MSSWPKPHPNAYPAPLGRVNYRIPKNKLPLAARLAHEAENKTAGLTTDTQEA